MVAVAGLALAAWTVARLGRNAPAAVIPGESETTLTVEVLNATDVDGLAREVARRLRRHGIDVVYFGSSSRKDLDSTRIILRRGDTSSAHPIRKALGGAGRVGIELDSRLLLDASVLVGRDLAPGALERGRP